MIYLLLFFSSFVFANPLWKWTAAIDIVEKHEFYGHNEIVNQPKDSWEILFAVIYKDGSLKAHKDCLFYRVPGNELGILKIKQINVEDKCTDYLFNPGDREWKGLRALQYLITDNRVVMYLTHPSFEVENWYIPMVNIFSHPKPQAQMSSATYRSPKIIFLTPHKENRAVFPLKETRLASKELCHVVTEECVEVSPSTCSQCAEGWYEVPNGCKQGPKYCGRYECGLKNQPACRRGMKYQRTAKDFNCRQDHSFAYCAKGLRIQCEGALPYCI